MCSINHVYLTVNRRIIQGRLTKNVEKNVDTINLLLNFGMERRATLLRKSKNGRKAIYIDDDNAESILAYLHEEPGNLKKFWMIVELILDGRPTRDLYDKENFERGCEHVAAMKLFKGKKNPRIYCQQYSHKEKKVYVIIASELLVKKTAQGLSKKEKSIIRRVAKYEYKLHDGKK